MRTLSFVFLALLVSCSNSNKDSSETSATDSLPVADSINSASANKITPIIIAAENKEWLQPVPPELIVSDIAGDSSVAIFTEKCVVLPAYSKKELADLEKSMSADEWEAFYDDLSYYGNEASLFLFEKTKTINESESKYLKFILTSGQEIIVDRYKSLELIFFFNPATGLRQCDTQSFNQDNFSDY